MSPTKRFKNAKPKAAINIIGTPEQQRISLAAAVVMGHPAYANASSDVRETVASNIVMGLRESDAKTQTQELIGKLTK